MTRKISAYILGLLALPGLWIALKWFFEIDDRYLPSPLAVVTAAVEIEPTVLVHAAYTWARLISGAVIGVLFGIAIALMVYRWQTLSLLLMPSLQSMRAVPPLAMVPFFLLWFGSSELGKFLLVVAGVAFNVAVASLQIAENIPERYRIFFAGVNRSFREFPFTFALPRIVESLLPTVRFSVATAAGLVVAAELLGSQVGLGYLMQSARSTFATHTIFLAAILLGALSAATDAIVRRSWSYLIFWDPLSRHR